MRIRAALGALLLLFLFGGLAHSAAPNRIRRRINGAPIAPLAAHTHLTAASSQFWSIASNATLQMGTGSDFTVAGWVRYNTLTAGQFPKFCGKGIAGAGNAEFDTWYGVTPHEFAFQVSSTGNALNGPGAQLLNTSLTAVTGTWYFLVFRYDGTNISNSVNNGAFSNVAFSGDVFANAQRLTWGGNDYGDNFLDGDLAACGIWRSTRGNGGALTAAQLTTLYNNRAALPYRLLPSSLKPNGVAYWDFEVDGNDRAGANHLTNNAGCTFAAGAPF